MATSSHFLYFPRNTVPQHPPILSYTLGQPTLAPTLQRWLSPNKDCLASVYLFLLHTCETARLF